MSKALGRIVLGLTALALIAFSRLAGAQANVTPDTAERRHALEIYSAGRYVDAMPLLENLVAEYPSDVQIREAWAFSIFAYSTSLSDPETRRKARIRARSVAVQAQKLGNKSPIVQMMLAIAEDGSEPSFSNRKDVDAAMKDGEAAFARGDLDKARESYLRASILDSGSYEAALFVGDTYFKQHLNGSAGEWFARATQIDSNRETAYRYWGDALSDTGKGADARDKYIQAVVAEPYNQKTWMALGSWAQKSKCSSAG